LLYLAYLYLLLFYGLRSEINADEMMMVMMVMIVRGSSAEKKRVYSKEGSWTGLDFKSGVKCK